MPFSLNTSISQPFNNIQNTLETCSDVGLRLVVGGQSPHPQQNGSVPQKDRNIWSICHEYPTQSHDLKVINLSYTLTPEENEVLSLGINFCIE